MKRLPRQLVLEHCYATPATGLSEKVIYNGIHPKKATFRAGLDAPVHRWFRLTPSFGPDLVREMLSALQCETHHTVLDPFAGAGTTLIECQREGITCYGFEINPFLHFVADTCLDWEFEPKELTEMLEAVVDQFRTRSITVYSENLAEQGLCVPPIHNPTRWWRPDVLTHLVLLKSCIDSLCKTERIRRFFRLALAGVLVPDLTNVTLGRLQLHFIDRTQDRIDVLSTFTAHAEAMIQDIHHTHRLKLSRTSHAFLTNATDTDGLALPNEVDCVITSPPYPNRYSYVWNTRPHLYLLDFLATARQASDIDCATVGGTWGAATSMLYKGILKPEYPVVEAVAGDLVNRIREVDNLMANYAMKYFNLLTKQIVTMDRLLSKTARIAYVVGCSRLKGVYVETDVLLGRIFEGLDLRYKVKAIERIRRRNSGKDLHESIVYAWKS